MSTNVPQVLGGRWDAYVSKWAGWFYVAFMPSVQGLGAGDLSDADVLPC